jgi:hypothetical protein
MAFACLSCCKSFKRKVSFANEWPAELACPECGGPAHNFGRHFKPPKKDDTKQWQKVRYLFDHGFRFQKIRIGPKHHDVISYPETLDEARVFVEKYKEFATK